MEQLSAENLVLEGGIGTELDAALRMVCEAEVDGQLRYPPSVCRDLKRAIACRNFASATLELCHLLAMAEACGGGSIDFVWGGGRATGAALRARLGWAGGTAATASAAPRITLGETEAVLEYDDGVFAISYGRMPFLVAFADFIAGAVGFAPLLDLVDSHLAGARRTAAVGEAANRLQKELYAYLKPRMVSAQAHRSLRSLLGYLTARFGPHFSVADVEDADILDFWRSKAADPQGQGDFRGFETALRAFLRLRQVLDTGLAKLAEARARPIGTDREAGEVDPGAVAEALAAVAAEGTCLQAFAEPPLERVKFLNKKEASALALLAECGAAAQVWALSVLRCEVFGAAQNRVRKAVRDKAPPERLDALIAEPPPMDYATCRDAMAEVLAHIDRTSKATLYALLRVGSPDALQAVGAAPEARAGLAARQDATVVAFPAARAGEARIVRLSDAGQVGEDVAARVGALRRAYGELNRKGFEPRPEEDPDRSAAFAGAVAPLAELRGLTTAYLDRLDTLSLPEGDWMRQFDADRTVFAEGFRALYGGRHETME